MITLREIEAAIRREAHGLWPEQAEAVDRTPIYLKPLQHMEFGHIGTDFAIRLGGYLRASPDRLAEALKTRLAPLLAVQIRVDSAFLNFRIPGLGVESEVGSTHAVSGQYSLVLRGSDERLQGWPFARLAARAALQAVLLQECGADLEIYVGERQVPAQRSSPAGEFRKILTTETAPSNLPLFLESLANRKPERRICAWLTPDLIESGVFTSLYKAFVQDRDQIVLRWPEKRWLAEMEEERGPETLLSWADPELNAAVYYLAGPLPGSELDMAVPLNREKANLPAYLDLTLERTGVILKNSPEHQNNSFAIEGLPEYEMLVGRTVFLPSYARYAAWSGEVGEFCEALAELLSLYNRFLNRPDVRAALAEGKGARALKIISGVQRRVSVIMPGNAGCS